MLSDAKELANDQHSMPMSALSGQCDGDQHRSRAER
jgi:hypothetical protein